MEQVRVHTNWECRKQQTMVERAETLEQMLMNIELISDEKRQWALDH